MGREDDMIGRIAFSIEDATIRQAMQAIQEGSANAGLAVDVGGVLVGIVTDGDIRRALLRGSTLDDPVEPWVRRRPITAHSSDSRSVVLDLMNSRGISQIPVIDDHGVLVGVHLLREFLGRVARPNLAFILAGGRGTRLGKLTESVPKPMVTVAGKPILERIVNHLVGFGITRIVISVGYLSEQIEEYFSTGHGFGCDIKYVHEDPITPLGTGGPLALLNDNLEQEIHPVLVLNGDLITQFDVNSLIAAHTEQGASVTVGGLPYLHEIPFGVLNVDESRRIISIEEKPTMREWVSGGIYVVDPQVIRRARQARNVPMTEILTNEIDQGSLVSMWPIEQDWIDVGRPTDLARARGLEA